MFQTMTKVEVEDGVLVRMCGRVIVEEERGRRIRNRVFDLRNWNPRYDPSRPALGHDRRRRV